MWGYDSCFFWCHFNALPTHQELARPTRHRMRRVILVTLTLTSAAWNAVLDDLPLTEIPRNGENLKGPGFLDFNSVGRCWNEYCWIIFDPLIHYQSLLLYLQILFATAEACALPIPPRWSTSSWVFVGTCTPAATPAAMSCWIFHKMMLVRLIWSSKISWSTGREGHQFRII